MWVTEGETREQVIGFYRSAWLVYVIDTNAQSQVKPEHRASEFFKEHCRVLSEVLHEAEGFQTSES